MGVQGLWELLAPVGRRVSVETLAGKKLAIDASIWMIQFMKAMRDEKGEMIRNAHILGFFRRICKLLYLRTKPVFVFDGGTPALKRRTVIARRRQRENAQAKVRKTAEKLLLNHLKAMRLREMAAGLEKQRQTDVKGKKAMIEEPSIGQNSEDGNKKEGPTGYSQSELDEMLAASLAAEENEEGFVGDASTSGVGLPHDDGSGDGYEDEDEDEEMILPEMHEKVDPAILASLPPSMQLDLLVQMRERLMAENRQKYQKVKKAPARFSELQIQAYLKTVAFRREIDGVQKSAAGRGIGGVQTSRIASEANREFIFSSSFTGDKQAFTSVGQERNSADQRQSPADNSAIHSVDKVVSTTRSGTAAGLAKSSGSSTGQTGTDTGKTFNGDVETYLDERGRVRVSKMRALGIRMTRDLQRNLDLMKEIEQEKVVVNEKDGETLKAAKVDVLGSSPGRIKKQAVTVTEEDRLNDEVEETEEDKLNDEVEETEEDKLNDEVEENEEPAVINNTSIEVTFEDIGELETCNEDDTIFARLVAGDPEMDFSVDNSASEKQSLHVMSDCEWEEGIIEDKINESLLEGATSDEGEVMWEEGFQDTQLKNLSYPDESHNSVSKGAQEEEEILQEAIRRSLEDMADHKANDSCQSQEPEKIRKTVERGIDYTLGLEKTKPPEFEATLVDTTQVTEPTCKTNILKPIDSKETVAPLEPNFDEINLDQKLLSQDAGGRGSLAGEMFSTLEARHGDDVLGMTEKRMDTCSGDANVPAVDKDVGTAAGSSSANLRSHRLLESDPADAQNVFHSASSDPLCEAEKNVNISANNSITYADALSMEQIYGDFQMDEEGLLSKPSFVDVDEENKAMDDRLEEEMLFLDKEREELGDQQRKLERNAESVSSEMFVECQELLQMFGLPYIIAPMEAEAQCAFMELSNLVDGVVTDDSDAFLFGARSVYKNIFDDRKYVETYLMKDIESELGLDREKLIHMALLLGSDYTEGVSGIGIVNAIEVVNAFPQKDGLQEFREWIESPDPTILGKLDVKAGGGAKRKGSKVGETVMDGPGNNLEGVSCDKNLPQSTDEGEKIKQIFMDKHRNVSKNWHIPSSFPSDAVISAYDSPQVDKSTESFSWGKPDLFVLRRLCWERFGWGASKADELLLPVLKEYNKHETQLRLEAFYTFNERFAKIRSKRIKKALKGITGDKSSGLMDETMLQQSGSGKKRKVNPTEEETNRSVVASNGPDCTDNSNQTSTTKEPKQLKGRQRKDKKSQMTSEHSATVDAGHNARRNSRIRGRHRGRGRGQIGGRGRKEENSCSEDSETGHDGQSLSERDGEMQNDLLSEPRQVRRSGRLRKNVNYSVGNEIDDVEEMEDCIDEGTTSKNLMDQAVGFNGTSANELDELVELGDEIFANEKDKPCVMNTMNASQIDGNQIRDPVSESQSSKDYLHSGGGFCVEEDEGEDDETELQGHASSPTRELNPEKSVLSVEEADHETDVSPRPSNVKKDLSVMEPVVNDNAHNDRVLVDHTAEESGNPYTRFLRAMPELRRKKRRT